MRGIVPKKFSHFQEEQQGLDPRKRRFLTRVKSRASSQEGAPGAEETGDAGNIDLDISNSASHRFQRERNSSDSAADYNTNEDRIQAENNW